MNGLIAVQFDSGQLSFEAAHAIDCSDTLLRSERVDQQIVGLWLNNIIAIAIPDALLTAHKNRVQDVKKILDYLKLKNIQQAVSYSKDFRPWGWFEILKLDDFFQAKRIFVKPGAAISFKVISIVLNIG
jgi:mannose-1-phosphate guanylyltransferase / mannose-6-phosphate isomerase